MRPLAESVVQPALIGSIGILLVIAATTLLRHRRLTFASAMLWVGMGLTGVLGAALLPFASPLGELLGVLPAALFTGVVAVLLGTIAFLLALHVSRLERDQQDLAEHVALAATSPPTLSNKGRPVLAIVPAFNEERSVAGVVAGLRGLGLAVLVIDDGSQDATASAAKAAGAEVLPLPINLGVGGALRAGFRYALRHGFAAVVQSDGDGQHPPQAVAELLASWDPTSTDLLVGSRYRDGYGDVEGSARRLAIRTLARLASRAARAQITDSTSGLRIIGPELLEELADKLQRHYLGDTFEMMYAAGRAGYLIGEVPVVMAPRAHGSSTATSTTAARLTVRALLTAVLGFYQPFRPRRPRP